MRPGRTTRLAATVLAAALTTAACSGGPGAAMDDVPVAEPTAGVTPSAPAPTSDGAPTSPTAGGSVPATDAPPQAGTPAPADPASPSNGGTAATEPSDEGLTAADDAAGVGANARAMLRGDRPTLVLEVDTQQGVDVDDDAVTHLTSVLAEVVDKPGGVVLEGGNEFSDTRTTWTGEDLREVAAANRTTHTTDDRVSVHVLYVAGSHGQGGSQTNAIGLAYSASTIAVFPQRWQGMASLLGSSEAIERAVLVHELGHLLSLVNLGYTSDLDHEDPDNPGHSSNDASAMYHAVETTLIGQVFSGPPPSTFDDADRSDLEGLRSGRL